MAIKFSDDSYGCVIEYFYLYKHEELTDKRIDWAEAQGIKVRGIEKPYNPSFKHRVGGLNDLSNALQTGDPADGSAYQAVREILRKLHSKDIIESSWMDIDKAPTYFEITSFGESLYEGDCYEEYLYGMDAVYDKWKGSVCCISVPDMQGIGSGFFLDTEIVVTAAHVCQELQVKADSHSKKLIVTAYDGSEYPVNFWRPHHDPNIDIAIILLDRQADKIKPFTLNAHPGVLQDVLILGYPPISGSERAYLVAHRGEISAIVDQHLHRNPDKIIISTLLRGGFSGGPVINSLGRVIGIVSENLSQQVPEGEKDLIQWLGYSAAVPAKHIIELLNTLAEEKEIDAKPIVN